MSDAFFLAMPDWIASDIAAKARESHESAGILLAGRAREKGRTRLLVRDLIWIDDGAYVERSSIGLTIASSAYMNILALAETRSDIPIWIHTHPGPCASPRPSRRDHVVDEALRETFRTRTEAPLYASAVFAPDQDLFSFTARVWQGEHSVPVSNIFVAGTRWKLITAVDTHEQEIPGRFDRQIRAFGGGVQQVLEHLRVAVVGCGGTGSAVAEQLVRLGVRDLLIVDPKTISESNPTRVYGSTPADIGKPKARVLGRHLRRLAPGTHVQPVVGSVTQQKVARHVTTCDLAFGCTDDNAGRLILSRLPTYYLTPVIDVGVLLSSSDGMLTGIDGRITILTPGQACLVCRGRIDLARAAAEQLPPDERARRQAEGYAPELGAVEPAVISFTSAVASFALGELLERLVGYGPDPEPGEVLLRFHDREISTNTSPPRPEHYCDPGSQLIGLGDREPFLGLTWLA